MKKTERIHNMKAHLQKYLIAVCCMVLLSCNAFAQSNAVKQPVDYVNPYIGNISHLLVPTFPTVHLPNSLLRVYPDRGDFTGDRINGLPLVVTSHRGTAAFSLSVYQGEEIGIKPVIPFSYDNEKVKPYYYAVRMDEIQTDVRFAPSHQSAVYDLIFLRINPHI